MRKQLIDLFDGLSIPENSRSSIIECADHIMIKHHSQYKGRNDIFWHENVDIIGLGRRHLLLLRYYLERVITIYKKTGKINLEEILSSELIEDPLLDLKETIATWEKEEKDLDRIRRSDRPYCSSCESSPCQCSDPVRTSSLY